jgi:hypothetical protein
VIWLVQAVCLNEASELQVRRFNAKNYRGSGCTSIVGGSLTHCNEGHAITYTYPAVLNSVHSTKYTAHSVENDRI